VLWNPALAQTRFDPQALRRHPRVRWHERAIAPFDPLSPWKLSSFLRESGAQFYLSPFYIRPAGRPCPVALTLHDVWPLRLPYGLSAPKRVLHRMLLRRAAAADAILTSSEFSRREIAELSPIPASKVHVVRLGVGAGGARPAAIAPAGVGARAFALGVGVNLPHKNLGLVAKAWGRLAPEPALDLVWAGPRDPRHPSLSSLASGAGAARVFELGRVSPGELEWLYVHARVLVFPSRYEGFGLPILESASRGLPVIASDIPVLREMGEGAAMFRDPDDAQAWADAVRLIARDESRRQAQIGSGRACAAALTYARTAAETLAVLRETAETSRTGARLRG
jgi:glycosyltransferase involved in cell wall biosynthesis